MPDVAWRPRPDWDRLFRGDRYRFEFGIRPAEGDWFRLAPAVGEVEVLADRSRRLTVDPDRYAPWLAEADSALEELLGFFPELGAAIKPGLGRTTAIQLASGWEPDFVLLRRGSGGRFRMVGGVVCDPSWWNPAEKLGLPVSEIHSPVPTLNETLGARIDTFLERLPAGATFARENWGLAAVPDRNLHPDLQRPRLVSSTPLGQSWLRVEYQAFRALPETGGIFFGIWLEVYPLREVLADASVRGAFCRMLSSMPPEIARYKGLQEITGPWLEQLGDGNAQSV